MKKIIILLVLVTVSMLNAIDLKEAQDIGLKNNLNYQNSVNSKKSVTASKFQAYSAILPSVTASGSYNGDDLDFGNTNYSLNLRQPLFQGGSIIYGMKIANTQEEIAENNLINAKVSLMADVESKYYSVLEAKALQQVAKTTFSRAELLLDTAETKYKLGAISRSELMQFKLEKSQSDVTLFSSDKQYKIALKEFNNNLSSSNQVPEEISTEAYIQESEVIANFKISGIEELSEKLSNQMLKQNLDLKNSQSSVETAKSYLRLSQTSFLPTVEFTASNSWIDNAQTDGLEDSQSFGLNVSVPIFPLIDKGLSYQTKKYDYLSSLNKLESSKDSTQLLGESAWLELVTAAKNLVSAQISFEYATSLYEQSSIEFKLGELSSSDYLNSSITLSNTESQYYSAIYNYLRSKSSLNKLLCEVDYSNLNKTIFNGVK